MKQKKRAKVLQLLVIANICPTSIVAKVNDIRLVDKIRLANFF